MSRWYFAAVSTLMLIILTACAPAPTATPQPTATPMLSATATPVNTPTPIATLAPLPTAQPTEADEQSLTDERLSERAKIRIVHTAPDFPEVDVYLGGQTVGFSLRFGDASGQADVVAGDYFLRFISVGGRVDDTPLLQVPISLQPDQQTIAVLLPDEDVAFFEENTQPLSDTEVRLQIINTIPNSPPVALPLEDTPQAMAFAGVRYGEQSDAVIYTPGDKELDFENSVEGYEINLFRRRAYTFVMAGNIDDPTVITFDESVPAQAALSVVNLSEEIGAVDVYLNGELLTSELAYSSEDDLIELPINTYNITVYEAGADTGTVTPLLEQRVNLNPDDEVFVLLMGPADALQTVTYQEAQSPTRAGETRITFVNTISTTPRLAEIRNEDQPITITYAQPTTMTYRDGVQNFEFVTNQTATDYTTIDVVLDQEYKVGHSYLVLLTGAGQEGESTLIYETVVGTFPSLDSSDDTDEQEAVPESPQMHLINTLDHTITVLVDGSIFNNQLATGGSTEVIMLAARTHTFTILDEQTQEQIYSTERVLQDDNQYTYVLFGDEETENFAITQFQISPDSPSFSEQSAAATVRLINTSLNTSQELALAYSNATTPEDRPTNRLATRQADGFVDEPIILPPDVTGFTNLSVTSGEAAMPIGVPSRAIDLYVYDTNTRRITATVYDVTLAPETDYDLIVTSQVSMTPYSAFLVESPFR